MVGVDGRELQGRPTGTGRYLRNLLRRWRETGDRLEVYFSGQPPEEPALDHPAITSHGVGRGVERGLVWQQALLPEAARPHGLQVFFSPAYSCPLRLPTPRVTAVHDLSFFSLPQDFTFRDALRRRALTAWSVGVSQAVLACSEFTRRELVGRFPAAAGRVHHVPLGPDDDLPPSPPRDEARRRLDVDGPYVITVGAILNRRRLPELLRAVRRLLSRHPALVLDVVGENRTHPPADFRQLVSALDLSGHVRLSGFVDEAELADRYAAADGAVFLSEYEGFGLPALEAAARGVPLVVSRAPSLGEIFGEAGLVVAPRDEVAIVRALDRLLSEPGLRASLTRAGRDLAQAYTWERTASATRQVLREVAGA